MEKRKYTDDHQISHLESTGSILPNRQNACSTEVIEKKDSFPLKGEMITINDLTEVSVDFIKVQI